MSSDLVARRGFLRMLASLPVIAAVGAGATKVVERAKEELEEKKVQATRTWRVVQDTFVEGTITVTFGGVTWKADHTSWKDWRDDRE